MELHKIPVPDWLVLELLDGNKMAKDWLLKSFSTFFYGYGMNSDSIAKYMAGSINTPITSRSVFIFHGYDLDSEIRDDKTLLNIHAWIPTSELQYNDFSKFVNSEVKEFEHDGMRFNWFNYSEPIELFHYDHLATMSELFMNLSFNANERGQLRTLLVKKRYHKRKFMDLKSEIDKWIAGISPLNEE